jgi:hypothetical protein
MMSEDLTWWSSLGNRCALAGVKRARERENTLKAWLEARSSNTWPIGDQDHALAVPQEARRARPGRRGLATATVSLRVSTPSPSSSPTANQILQPQTRVGPPPKVHIIPSSPFLLSLSASPLAVLGDSAALNAEMRVSMIAAFKTGWEDGLRILQERRSRLATTFLRSTALGQKVRFLKFKNTSDGDDEEGFEGLEDVKTGDEGAFLEHVEEQSRAAPILCLSGLGHESHDEDHVHGCGHSVAASIWIEEL